MQLGAFSLSLAVKDLQASRAFYELYHSLDQWTRPVGATGVLGSWGNARLSIVGPRPSAGAACAGSSRCRFLGPTLPALAGNGAAGRASRRIAGRAAGPPGDVGA